MLSGFLYSLEDVEYLKYCGKMAYHTIWQNKQATESITVPVIDGSVMAHYPFIELRKWCWGDELCCNSREFPCPFVPPTQTTIIQMQMFPKIEWLFQYNTTLFSSSYGHSVGLPLSHRNSNDQFKWKIFEHVSCSEDFTTGLVLEQDKECISCRPVVLLYTEDVWVCFVVEVQVNFLKYFYWKRQIYHKSWAWMIMSTSTVTLFLNTANGKMVDEEQKKCSLYWRRKKV